MFISHECLLSERLIVSVFDEDTNGSDLIGRCSVALINKSAAWFELRTDGGDGAPGDVAGQLQLTVVSTPVHLDYNRDHLTSSFYFPFDGLLVERFWDYFVFVLQTPAPSKKLWNFVKVEGMFALVINMRY